MQYPYIEVERIKHQMTKEELAESVGVSRRTVSNWQSGRTQIPLKKLLLMSELFNCTTGYLLGREGDT